MKLAKEKLLRDAELVYASVLGQHAMLFGQLQRLLDASENEPLEVAADIAYFLHSAEKVTDELRKEIHAKVRRISERISTTLLEKALNGDTSESCVRGEYTTAIPNPKMRVPIPSRGSELHNEICSALGVPEGARGAMKFSYDGVSDLLTTLQGEGKPIPECFKKPFIEHNVTYRRKSNGSKHASE